MQNFSPLASKLREEREATDRHGPDQKFTVKICVLCANLNVNFYERSWRVQKCMST